MNEIDYEVIECMRAYGGNFHRQLARMYACADLVNAMKMREMWAEEWQSFRAIADTVKGQDPKAFYNFSPQKAKDLGSGWCGETRRNSLAKKEF